MWFEEVKGYNLVMCHEFYKNLSVFGENGVQLRTNMRGKTSQVTLTTIATVMEYERPPLTTPVYPHNVYGGSILANYVALTYEDPTTLK